MTPIPNCPQEDDEIKSIFLSELKNRQGRVRIAVVNSQCYDEAKMWKVLRKMQSQKEIALEEDWIITL